MTYRSEHYRIAVRALPCTLRLVEGCPTGLSVLAHINEGKGTGMKTDDVGAAACPGCHAEVDSGRHLTRAERRYFLQRGTIRTVTMLLERDWLGWKVTHKQLFREVQAR